MALTRRPGICFPMVRMQHRVPRSAPSVVFSLNASHARLLAVCRFLQICGFKCQGAGAIDDAQQVKHEAQAGAHCRGPAATSAWACDAHGLTACYYGMQAVCCRGCPQCLQQKAQGDCGESSRGMVFSSYFGNTLIDKSMACACGCAGSPLLCCAAFHMSGCLCALTQHSRVTGITITLWRGISLLPQWLAHLPVT